MNFTEHSLSVSSESAAESLVANEPAEMHSQPVLCAAEADLSDNASSHGDKSADSEARCRVIDGVRYEWTDITTDFIGACSSLELGELVHDTKYVELVEQEFYRICFAPIWSQYIGKCFLTLVRGHNSMRFIDVNTELTQILLILQGGPIKTAHF